MKKIWEILKDLWPVAKQFICLTEQEAIELDAWADFMEASDPSVSGEIGRPKVLDRIKNELKK